MRESPEHPGERFSVVEQLGSGGMGVVYRARDAERGVDVALKRLSQTDPASVARFKREFRVLADISHPNLVQLYELIATGEELFFTMELVAGQDFLKWVRPSRDVPTLSSRITDTLTGRTGTTSNLPLVAGNAEPAQPPPVVRGGESATSGLDFSRLRSALRQLASGVAAIHRAGVLHRDLKPSNVLVADDGRVVVLDFGIAADRSQWGPVTAVENRVVGTPHFMAPEQAAGKPAQPASDWYAVGAMLYAAITGEPPYTGTRDNAMRAKQRFEARPPQLLAPDAPEDLCEMCVELLRIDPEHRMSGAELLQRLGVSDAAPVSRARASTADGEHRQLIGRGPQLDALDAALADARSGRSVVALVQGRSGMGKSALLRVFARRQHAEPVAVLRGRCYQRESVPFKALDSLVDALTGWMRRLGPDELLRVAPRQVWSLMRMFPVFKRVEGLQTLDFLDSSRNDPVEMRRRAFGALRDLFGRMAAVETPLLMIDDVQWGDLDSAELLAELVRPPDAPPLLLVASHRAEDADSSVFLREFSALCAASGADLRRIEVGPLDQAAARELAASHLGRSRAAAEFADRVAAESHGTPFFVEELARWIQQESTPPTSDVVSLQEVLRSRQRQLAEPARRLLGSIALAARPIPERVATRSAGVDDPGAMQVLINNAFAIARSTRDGTFVECYHDQLREAAVGLLSESETRERYRLLADALRDEPRADPEELAECLHGAGEEADAARCAARAAAQASEALAFDRSARLYRWALELDPDAEDRRALHEALGDALRESGRGADAAEAYLLAVEGAGPERELELRRRASEQLLRCGQIERGRAILDDVLATFGMRLPHSRGGAVAALLWHRARLAVRGLAYRERSADELDANELLRIDSLYAALEGLANVQPIPGAVAQARYLRLALRAGERSRIAQGLAGEVMLVSRAGTKKAAHTAKSQRMLDAIAEQDDDPFTLALARSAAGVSAVNEGRFRDAHDHLEATVNLFENECRGKTFEVGLVDAYRAITKTMFAPVSEVDELVSRRWTDALERDDLFTASIVRAAGGHWPALADDDPEAAHRALDEAVDLWRVDGFHMQHLFATFNHSMIDIYAGRGQPSLDRLAEAEPGIRRTLRFTAQTVRSHFAFFRGRSAVVAALAGGDRERLLRAAEGDARRIERERAPYAQLYGILLRADIAGARGDTERQVALLADAEARAEEQGLNTLVYGNWLRRGELIGGDEGAALVARGTEALRELGFGNPHRAAMWAALG